MKIQKAPDAIPEKVHRITIPRNYDGAIVIVIFAVITILLLIAAIVKKELPIAVLFLFLGIFLIGIFGLIPFLREVTVAPKALVLRYSRSRKVFRFDRCAFRLNYSFSRIISLNPLETSGTAHLAVQDSFGIKIYELAMYRSNFKRLEELLRDKGRAWIGIRAPRVFKTNPVLYIAVAVCLATTGPMPCALGIWMLSKEAPLLLVLLMFGVAAVMTYFSVVMFFPLVTRLVFEKDTLKIHTLGKRKPSVYAYEQCSIDTHKPHFSKGDAYWQIKLVAEGKNYPLFFSHADIELLKEAFSKPQSTAEHA